MSIPETATKFCVQCKEVRFIGTRCFRCYIRMLARDRNLLKYAWMSREFEKFVNLMRGRYTVIRAGGEPPPLDPSLKTIWTKGARPFWISHPNRVVSRKPPVDSEDRLRGLIAAVERRAREDRSHEADGCGQEDR